MLDYCFYCAGYTNATDYAIRYLQNAGFRFADTPDNTVTHLLLPVPSFDPTGQLRGGGDLHSILNQLPESVAVIGGNLPDIPGHTIYDLMKDPEYVAQNAYITAHCALGIITDKLQVTLRGCKVLVIGWGRIGKCLAALLKGMEAQVTVAARKASDRAILGALGYTAVPVDGLCAEGYRVIVNTVPAPVLPESSAGALKLDLASVRGIAGTDVRHARGLPGIAAPEESGTLIGRSIIHLLNKEASV